MVTEQLPTQERADAVRAVEQAVKVAGRLAHDFGNCLTGILGFTELTMKQVPEGSLSQVYLKEVWRSAQEGASWVHKLQSLSRGKATRYEPADPAALLREESERVRPLLGDGTSIALALETPLPLVDMDREAVRQVLGHLLDNARESIRGQGVIHVAARTEHLEEGCCLELLGDARPGDFVAITITDAGIGLPPEVPKRLCTDFFISTKPGKRGLGLLTVVSMLQSYRGGIRFGPPPEHGTAVRVYLPVLGEAS